MEKLPEVLSLSFADGLVHLLRDPALPEFSAAYYAPTSIITHGGAVRLLEGGQTVEFGKREDEFTRPAGERLVRRVDSAIDRAEFVANFAAECSNWVTLARSEDFDRETRELLREAVPQDSAHRKVKVRIAQDVPLFDFPLGPWLATPEGILDRDGTLVYRRVLPEAEPAAPAARGGFAERVRGLFGGGKR